jgi:hypothetical protein
MTLQDSRHKKAEEKCLKKTSKGTNCFWQGINADLFFCWLQSFLGAFFAVCSVGNHRTQND